MTFSVEWTVAIALVVLGAALWRVTDVLRSVVDTHGRSAERNAIIQNRFIERMYEKTHARNGEAVPLANMHARESGQMMHDELNRDGIADRQIKMEAAKIRRERENPKPDATSPMDLGV